MADALGGAEIVAGHVDRRRARRQGALRARRRARPCSTGEVDLGVHSAKDLPGDRPDGLTLVGVAGARGPADAYIGAACSLADAPRRRARRHRQPSPPRPALGRCAPTSRSSSCAATSTPACASSPRATRRDRARAAGLRRLGRDAEIAFAFGIEELTPGRGPGLAGAPGARRTTEDAAAAAARSPTAIALVELTAERAAVAALEATCDTPVGVCARLGDETLACRVRRPARRLRVGARPVEGDPDQPAALGEALAERMLAAGRARDPEAGGGAARERARAGVVYLVGAGPGRPGPDDASRALELVAERRRRSSTTA